MAMVAHVSASSAKKAHPAETQPKADAAVRVARVVELTLAGWTNAGIATAVGISETQVSHIRGGEAYKERYATVLADLENVSREARTQAIHKAWSVIDAALDGRVHPIAAQTARWLVDHVEPGPEQRIAQDVHVSGRVEVETQPDLTRLSDEELDALARLVNKTRHAPDA